MAGTWPLARANIVTQLDGITFDAGAGYASETLTALEYPPSSVQDSILPYCYVQPPSRSIRRMPGGLRYTDFDAVTVRVILGGVGTALEDAAKRMEVAVEACANAFDDAVNLDGNADVVTDQQFSGLLLFDGEGYGFEMTLVLRVSEIKTFGP